MITIYNALVGALGKDYGEYLYRRHFANMFHNTIGDQAPECLKNHIFGLDKEFPELCLVDRRIVCMAQHGLDECTWRYNLVDYCRSEDAKTLVEKAIRDNYYREKCRMDAE